MARKPREPLRFIEIKYRESTRQGSGFGYITPAKQRQMAFAAELYVTKTGHTDEYMLSVIELSGPDYTVTGFVEVT